MKKVLFLIIIGLSLSCDYKGLGTDFRKERERIEAFNDMMRTDAEFAERTTEVGIKQAFKDYIEVDPVLLFSGKEPLTGGKAVDYLISMDDDAAKLSWEALGGDLSQGADMGYTYGTYQLNIADSVYSGSYVTIWKKQPDGTWKFLLDSRNEGVPEK